MKQLQEEMKIVRQGQEEIALSLERSAARKEPYMSKKRSRERTPARFYKQAAGGGQDGDSYGVRGEGGCEVFPLGRAVGVTAVGFGTE